MSPSEGALILFLGDGEREFRITPKLVRELERVTDTGVGTLFKRIAQGHFHFSEVTEIIRLALIGGGTSPEEAARLCTVYVESLPLNESYPLALQILERLWFGAPVLKALAAEIERSADA